MLIYQKSEMSNSTSKMNKRMKIVQEIKRQIQEGLSSEVVNELNNNYSTFKLKMDFFEKLEEDFDLVKRRLFTEVEKLSSRANLNLAIGAGASLVAIIILGVTVWVKPEELIKTSDIISYLLPRVSLVIFIEIFAFFFLRLYKTTLGDIKYYQNELTNIDFKVIGIKIRSSTPRERYSPANNYRTIKNREEL